MVEKFEATQPRTIEESLRGMKVTPRPGHSFDALDLEYFKRIGATVDKTMAPEEGSSSSH